MITRQIGMKRARTPNWVASLESENKVVRAIVYNTRPTPKSIKAMMK